MNKGKPGVMIYFETAKALKALDYEMKGRLFEAIMDYAEDGVVPSFDGVLAAVWPFVADKIERDSMRYADIVEKKRKAGRASAAKRQALADERQQVLTDVDECQQIQPTTTGTVTPSVTETITGAVNGNGTKRAIAPPPPKSTKHKHGEYSNVLLTDEELDKLQADFPSRWAELVENLSEYIESTGKAYKSHYATIRSWARKDKEEAKKTRDGYPANPCDSITSEDHEKDSENPW